MSLAALLHLILHVLVPLAFARIVWRRRWLRVFVLLMATMLVDLDHLLATPIYDPERCSIGFHPLHTAPAVAVYALLAALPQTRIIGTGLLIHMALDAGDCVAQKGLPAV